MNPRSSQRWYCNACGSEQDSPPGRAYGREFRCCSLDCVREMNWRSVLSTCGEAYRPRAAKEPTP